MNIISYLEEDKVAFLRTPKFLRKLLSPHAAELYALLREHRRYMIDKKKIRNHDSWFFYSTKQLREDLCPPNSPNHLRLLLTSLEIQDLIEIKIDDFPPFRKWYRINDAVYFKLAQEQAHLLTRKNSKEFDEIEKKKKNNIQDWDDEDFEN